MAQAFELVGRRTHPLTGVIQGALWAAAGIAGLVSSFANGGGALGASAGVVGGLLIGMIAGFLSWWFTRYVINGTELRINSGVLTKKSRRIPYERLQSVDIAEPLLARIFGLAELRIEMAGGKDSRTTLRYLPLTEARSLRRVLLDRAHGNRGDPEDPEHPASESRQLITEVGPDRIMIGTLLSLDFLFSVAGVVALIIGGLWFSQFIAVLGGLIPLGAWLLQIVARRVIAQWGFKLTRGDRGLRIERGFLSRTSQTIPFARVQGIAIEEPFVWRRLGWQRLEVDVAGYASQSDNSGTNSSSTLLPISDPTTALHVIDELIAEAKPDEVSKEQSSPSSWWFAPIGWRYRFAGADDKTFVSVTGWIQRRTSIVPHHKTQSVAFKQGPLQRIRNVATVNVHTPKGPVNAECRHLDQAVARDLAFAQLDHARRTRDRIEP